MSLTPQQQLVSLEKWLLEFDPAFGEVLSGLSALQQHRAKRNHDLKFQLHTYHRLFIDVYVAYFIAVVAVGQDNLRVIQYLARAAGIMTSTLDTFAPEKVAFEHKYATAGLSLLAKKNISKKMSQGIRQDLQNLQAHVEAAR